eukprot:1120508-Pleurochrysis_carterae.AAC.1
MEHKFAFAGSQDVQKKLKKFVKTTATIVSFTVRRRAPSLAALQCPASHNPAPRAISLTAWRLARSHPPTTWRRAPSLTTRRVVLSPSRSPAPCAVPLSQPGAERGPLTLGRARGTCCSAPWTTSRSVHQVLPPLPAPSKRYLSQPAQDVSFAQS